ncbi:MAG: dodecin domain-containing protein [Bacteroidales bacterium]|nr:dodecin domain-containing protein [Bacteroidales bacterium]
MADSVYKVIELIGTSEVSWEDAARKAIETALKSLDDVRIAEVVEQDVRIENGKISAFRVRIRLSFRYHGKE